MKKFVWMFSTVLLILAFGTMVYAQPKLEFKASGFIDAATDWGKNMATTNTAAGLYRTVPSTFLPGGGAYDQTNAWMSSRCRLKFDAVMEKNLSGTIFFEMDSTRWGDTYGTADQRNYYGYWSGDRGAVEVKNVYIDFGLPSFGVAAPMTMRVGLQPLAIRTNMLVYTDGMGVTMNIKADPVTIAPLWFKALEGRDATSDDVDVYGVHIFGKADAFNIGGYALYYDMKTYPFYTTTVPAYGVVTDNKAKMWWFGVYADGKLGPVDLNFDFILDNGKVKSRSGLQSVDYTGFATRLKIDYPWEKFNFGFVGMYASGADAKKTDTTGYANGTNSKVRSYVTPPGSEAPAIFAESQVFYCTPLDRSATGIGGAWNYTSLSRGTLGGTWMAKLYGSYKVSPSYKMTVQGLYIGDTTKNANTVGTARKADGVTYKDDKTIGWEFDLINEFQIYKNLKYSIGAGVLLPGDGLKYWDGTGNDKPSTPWSVISMIIYNF